MEIDEKKRQEIMDKLTKVCICKSIPRSVFKKAIANADGNITLEELRRITGAGSGPCGGKRCTPKILDLIEEYRREK